MACRVHSLAEQMEPEEGLPYSIAGKKPEALAGPEQA